jgi:hypothetical protein
LVINYLVVKQNEIQEEKEGVIEVDTNTNNRVIMPARMYLILRQRLVVNVVVVTVLVVWVKEQKEDVCVN